MLSAMLGFQDLFPCLKTERFPSGGDFEDIFVAELSELQYQPPVKVPNQSGHPENP